MSVDRSRPIDAAAAALLRRGPRASRRRNALLIFSQVFVPDPASVGQHLADVAREMARRGHGVRVYTAARGYEDPSVRYPRYEEWDGVQVRRLPASSFGKRTLLTRIFGTALFMLQVLFVGLFARDVAGIFFSTSPPLVGLVATLVARLRGVPAVYWAMDLNPDQLIALGKLPPRGPLAHLLEAVNRFILRHATLIVALDRFMAERLERRTHLGSKLLVMPPWPHEDRIAPPHPAPNPFRAGHGLEGKFVVMYSGNHSRSNPLDTLLSAMLHFKDDPEVRFLFVGGGTGKDQVEQFIARHGLTNAVSLPYQPLADLRYSLAAADVHVVSLGEPMVGIIHPCKVYGAMAAARPVLYLGPRQSHIADLLDQYGFGWHVDHGDVTAAVDAIRRMRDLGPEGLQTMGANAAPAIADGLSQRTLCGRLCDALDDVLRPAPNEPRVHHDAETTMTTTTPAAVAGNGHPSAAALAAAPRRPGVARVCITGGTGFIGSYFFHALRQQGHEVVLFDHAPAHWDTGGAPFVAGDTRDRDALKRAFEGCDAVLHLAAAHHDFGIAREEYFDVNEEGSRAVCDAADACGVRSICFYSSVAVFGTPAVAPDEATAPTPASDYGQSKLAGEQVFRAWATGDARRTCLVIRPTVTFGPRNFANMYSLIRQIHTRRFVPIGDGHNVKSLAYVENIVDATLFLWNLAGRPRFGPAASPACESGGCDKGGGFEIFNYIDKPDLSSRQIVEACYRSLGRRAPRFNVPLPVALVMGLPFDVAIKATGKNLPVSTARMKKLCTQTKFEADKVRRAGFVPRVSLEEGIDRMVKWYLAEGRHAAPIGGGGAQ